MPKSMPLQGARPTRPRYLSSTTMPGRSGPATPRRRMERAARGRSGSTEARAWWGSRLPTTPDGRLPRATAAGDAACPDHARARRSLNLEAAVAEPERDVAAELPVGDQPGDLDVGVPPGVLGVGGQVHRGPPDEQPRPRRSERVQVP